MLIHCNSDDVDSRYLYFVKILDINKMSIEKNVPPKSNELLQ